MGVVDFPLNFLTTKTDSKRLICHTEQRVIDRVSGLAYSAGMFKPKAAEPIRLPAALIFAGLIHVIPMAYLIMPAPVVPPDEPETVSVDLSELPDFALNPSAATTPATEPKAVKPPPPASIAPSEPAAPAAPATPAKPATPVPQPPPPSAPKTPAPAVAKAPAPATPPPAPAKPVEEKKSDTLAVSPLSKSTVAFDNSNVTSEKPPDDAFASDSNSTAADNGPKNLPRGKTYNKDGQSAIQTTLGKSGEGDLPPITTTDTAGSVKVQGTPDVGKGIASTRPDEERPFASLKPADLPDAAKHTPAPAAAPTKAKDSTAAPEIAETITPKTKPVNPGAARDLSGNGTMPIGENVQKAPEKTAKGLTRNPDETPQPVNKIDAPESTFTAAPGSKVDKKKAELDAFAAMLDGAPNTNGNGGDSGDKAGVQGRKGQKGREGDGTLRPGDEKAVDKIAMFNLNSSAEEIGAARFAKRKDPVATYFRPIVERAVNKWRARGATTRIRVVTGLVTVRVVMLKSGKRLETVVEERSEGLPDEYVEMVKDAFEQATTPNAEPFTGELAKEDRTQMTFTFVY